LQNPFFYGIINIRDVKKYILALLKLFVLAEKRAGKDQKEEQSNYEQI